MANPDQTRLSERQHLAIDALLGGATHNAAAEAADVSRTTITGWSNHNVHFIAELAQRRQQRADHLSDLIAEALVDAIAVMRDKIVDGDLGAAVALVRIVEKSSLYRAPRRGAISPMSVTRELSNELDTDLVLDSYTTGPAVFAIEDLSEAHQDKHPSPSNITIDNESLP